jgi:hypothetical protein
VALLIPPAAKKYNYKLEKYSMEVSPSLTIKKKEYHFHKEIHSMITTILRKKVHNLAPSMNGFFGQITST